MARRSRSPNPLAHGIPDPLAPDLADPLVPDLADPLVPDLAATTGMLLAALPKAELHLHLDGSLRPSTALELARERGLVTPGTDLPAIRTRLTAPLPCRDQAQLLRAFELPIAILQDGAALERAAHELVLDVAGEGTRYVEIRWAPALHTARGLGLQGGIAAVAAGVRSGALAATGTLPAAADALAAGAARSIVVRLIVVAMRSHDPASNEAVARAAVAAAPDGVTGFDLAGPEAAFPDPLAHRRAFAIARAGGLGLTVHAGEWGGARQVRRALALDPDRIAHGAPAAADPALLTELRARGTTLDLCPSSNWQAGLVASLADHPLPALLHAGVPVTLSTDDRTVSQLTLTREYGRAHATLGLSLAELWALDRHALEVAFLQDDEAARDLLRAAFVAFAAGEPRLAGDVSPSVAAISPGRPRRPPPGAPG